MSEADAMRSLIASHAIEAVYRGGHYLSGSTGQCPGQTDPLNNRTVSPVHETTYGKIGILTVKLSKKRCQGRYERAGGRKMKDDKETRAAIEDYVRTQQERSASPAGWAPFEGWLYPRRTSESSPIYLGESCDGRQHFDCIGFVNYCIRRATGRKVSHDVFGWFKGGGGLAEVFPAPEQSKLLDGDILLRLELSEGALDDDKIEKKEVTHGHIALATKAGVVYEASDFPIGTNHKSYVKEKWTHVARIKDRYLKP